MAVVESRKFSLFNVDGKNNKFWNIFLYDNGDVEVQYGPQGGTGQKKTFSGVGRPYFEKKIREKTSPKHSGGAYVENKVLDAVVSNGSSQSVSKHTLAQKAVKDIGADQPELKKLITYFADVNAHNLYEASGGKITYDTSTGTFKTTQGVISLDQVQEARNLLDSIEKFAERRDFTSMGFKAVLNPYLSLIPQKGLVRQLDFPSMFSISGGLQRQTDILDGLESSYATVIAAAQKDNGKVVESVQEEKLFRVKLEVATGKDFDNIKKYYNDTKGSHYDVQSYDVKQVWLLVIEHMAEAFNKDGAKLQNIWTLWHGSSACNYLSILKAGMIVPRGGGSIRITGRLFSDGLYFSDQSTKSIRYATGAWGGAGVKDRKFMLINNVAMGKYHVPRGSQYSYRLPSGYDSCFAKAGESGVQNNEMVVYRTSVVNPTHLVEFTPYGK